jgi:hypothetical protein
MDGRQEDREKPNTQAPNTNTRDSISYYYLEE